MRTYQRMLIALTLTFILLFAGIAQASQVQSDKPDESTGVNTGYPLEKWRIDTVISDGSNGLFASLALDPDHAQLPWISYHRELDEATSDLWIATRVGIAPGNCGPSNQWYCGSIASEAYKKIGGYTSIDIFPDIDPDPEVSTWKVGVSYINYTDKTLNYAQYSCPGGECSWGHAVVDDFGGKAEILTTTSLKFDSTGNPNIAYQATISETNQVTYSLVKWAEWYGVGGNCGVPSLWYCEVIVAPQTNSIDQAPSLAVSPNDMVAIAFHGPVTNSLNIAARLGNGEGNCGTYMNWYCEMIDNNGGDVGQNPSLHAPLTPGGLWYVGYYAASNEVVRRAFSNMNGAGNCGDGNNWYCVDVMPTDSFRISFDIVDFGSAVMAFSSRGDGDPNSSLALASQTHTGAADNCAEGWWCGTLEAGTATLIEGIDISLKINAEGRAMIAYTEDDLSGGGNDWNLKYAVEQEWLFLPVAVR